MTLIAAPRGGCSRYLGRGIWADSRGSRFHEARSLCGVGCREVVHTTNQDGIGADRAEMNSVALHRGLAFGHVELVANDPQQGVGAHVDLVGAEPPDLVPKELGDLGVGEDMGLAR